MAVPATYWPTVTDTFEPSGLLMAVKGRKPVVAFCAVVTAAAIAPAATGA